MATHSSVLAWRIPWTEEPGRLQSRRSQRVRHDRAWDEHSTYVPGGGGFTEGKAPERWLGLGDLCHLIKKDAFQELTRQRKGGMWEGPARPSIWGPSREAPEWAPHRELVSFRQRDHHLHFLIAFSSEHSLWGLLSSTGFWHRHFM